MQQRKLQPQGIQFVAIAERVGNPINVTCIPITHVFTLVRHSLRGVHPCRVRGLPPGLSGAVRYDTGASRGMQKVVNPDWDRRDGCLRDLFESLAAKDQNAAICQLAASSMVGSQIIGKLTEFAT
jgi:hypothetical protein